MGIVYLAEDTQLTRKVALKIPTLKPEAERDVVERFRREAQLAAKLDHPNLCPIYEVGIQEGVHYLTMPFIEGKPLTAFFSPEKPLAERQAALIIRKIAAGLSVAHKLGVIHRDIKPSNILINTRKEAILIDFGLAKWTGINETAFTTPGLLVGTVQYMSPEQVMGDPEKVSTPCDIYALGVVLYELLTGHPPFRGTSAAVLGQILAVEPAPPSTFRPNLDVRLQEICLRAMAKEVSARFPNVDEFARALGAFLQANAPAQAFGEPQPVTAKADESKTSQLNPASSVSQLPPLAVPPPLIQITSGPNESVEQRETTNSFSPPSKPDPWRVLRRKEIGFLAIGTFLGVGVCVLLILSFGGHTSTTGDGSGGLSSKQQPSFQGTQQKPITPDEPERNAIHLDGSTTFITPIERQAPITLEAWASIYPPTKPGDDGQMFILGSDIPKSSGIGILSRQTKQRGQHQLFLQFLPQSSNMHNEVTSEEAVVAEKTWFHVAGVFGEKETVLFVNGKPLARTGSSKRTGGTNFCIGRAGTANRVMFFTGQLSMIRISQGERYKTPFEPEKTLSSGKDTLALYRASGFQRSLLLDSSGLNNHATPEGKVDIKPRE